MSGFLNHLAAKGRGTVPRLEPRRPAPFEGLPDGPVADAVEPMPQTSNALTGSAVAELAATSSPTVAAAAAAVPGPAVSAGVSPGSSPRPAPVDSTRVSNTPSPAPVANASPAPSPAAAPSATPAAAPSVTRRMVDAAPSVPLPVAPASPPTTQTNVPRQPPKATPASTAAPPPTAATGRPGPAQSSGIGVQPNVERLRPEIDSPQTPPTIQAEQRTLTTPSARLEPVPVPLLQAEVQAPRPFAQASAQPPGGAAPITEAPVVEVYIGTIEVAAAQPPPPIPQLRTAPSRGTSLDDFLDRTDPR